MPAFLETYLPVVNAIRFGHPLAVEQRDDPLPELDFGPVIHATKASDLSRQFDEAVHGGGIPLYRGSVGDGRFLDVQDTSAYIAPACVLQPPASWSLTTPSRSAPSTRSSCRHAGRAAGGHERVQRQLGGSIATDDTGHGADGGEELQAFKVGINKPRSRGDREEVFGASGFVEGLLRRR